jgi:pyruvate dehydrogenase E2 component (dihydrolipoamide acetyltransferase)
MAEPLPMPKLSDTMTSGTIVHWNKKEGDAVEPGDELAEVETDKATMPIESFDRGVLLKILAPPGTVASCGAPIAFLGKEGEIIDEATLEKAKAAVAGQGSAPSPASPSVAPSHQASAPAAAAATATLPAPLNAGKRVKASPLARKVARERGVNLSSLGTGSGPGGRIVKKDVLAINGAGSESGVSLLPRGPIAAAARLPLSSMRQTIARRLLESKTQIPHFYQEIEIDAAPLLELRASVNGVLEKLPRPVKFSVNDFMLKACAQAMRSAPAINSAWAGDAILQYESVHLAFAVAIPEGLITPVVRDAQDKSLKQISDEAKALAAKARDGKLKPDEFQGGTFTVSNLGMLGIDRFSAIINPPQAAILAVGNIVKKAVVADDDRLVPGQRMSLTLSCDHRVVDGAIGASYLSALRLLLENPAALLL